MSIIVIIIVQFQLTLANYAENRRLKEINFIERKLFDEIT